MLGLTEDAFTVMHKKRYLLGTQLTHLRTAAVKHTARDSLKSGLVATLKQLSYCHAVEKSIQVGSFG